MRQWLETVYRDYGWVAAIAVGLSLLAGILVVAGVAKIDFAKASEFVLELLR